MQSTNEFKGNYPPKLEWFNFTQSFYAQLQQKATPLNKCDTITIIRESAKRFDEIG